MVLTVIFFNFNCEAINQYSLALTFKDIEIINARLTFECRQNILVPKHLVIVASHYAIRGNVVRPE
jgi:hypothetical protein